MYHKAIKKLVLKELKVDWCCSSNLLQMMVAARGYKGIFRRSDKVSDKEIISVAIFLGIIRKPTVFAKKKSKAGRRLALLQSGDEFYSSQAWREVRYFVLKRDGRRCVCCGATPDNFVQMHVDHIKPRSLRPDLSLDPNNLQILCLDCNLGKLNKDSIDWRSKMIERIDQY